MGKWRQLQAWLQSWCAQTSITTDVLSRILLDLTLTLHISLWPALSWACMGCWVLSALLSRYLIEKGYQLLNGTSFWTPSGKQSYNWYRSSLSLFLWHLLRNVITQYSVSFDVILLVVVSKVFRNWYPLNFRGVPVSEHPSRDEKKMPRQKQNMVWYTYSSPLCCVKYRSSRLAQLGPEPQKTPKSVQKLVPLLYTVFQNTDKLCIIKAFLDNSQLLSPIICQSFSFTIYSLQWPGHHINFKL